MTTGPEDARPVGERLGSERLYSQRLGEVQTPPPPTSIGPVRPARGKPSKDKAAKPAPVAVPESADTAKQADGEPRDWPNIVSTALELAGIVAITAGCGMIAPYLAFIVGGVLILLLGVAIGWGETN